jgi:hypothetical protein
LVEGVKVVEQFVKIADNGWLTAGGWPIPLCGCGHRFGITKGTFNCGQCLNVGINLIYKVKFKKGGIFSLVKFQSPLIFLILIS